MEACPIQPRRCIDQLAGKQQTVQATGVPARLPNGKGQKNKPLAWRDAYWSESEDRSDTDIGGKITKNNIVWTPT